MSFQPAFNARLIAEVKKYPCLYNHSKRGSGDTMERMRIWENIASAVDNNCSGDFAKKRWLQLRDRYRKELKTAIKQNFVTPVRWCYFSHLSWLDPYLKDNLVLSACDGYNDSSDGFSSCVDALGLNSMKAELDDSSCDQSTAVMETSVIDRLLASTHQLSQQQKDDCKDQNVSSSVADMDMNYGVGKSKETENIEDERHFTSSGGGIIQMSHCFSSPALKSQVLARCQQMDTPINKQFVSVGVTNAGKNTLDWINDEDFLYCRIIGLRLKKLEPRKRKRIRAQIMSLLDESEGELEEDDDSMSSPNLEAVDTFDHSIMDVPVGFHSR
ncbi:hypothetical protein DICVIV_11946 [Dictyocaulus viviparus]|uniref:MADF domain-containing protein n=1 Tax=Dictyocaulus viviparus TaxID=29172 RepID=A0A0D8XBS7_DICVI|nr:hypothetical protein DICVIV_11946 [Dictyocaulus viviparus]